MIYNNVRAGDDVYKDLQTPEGFTRALHQCICINSNKVALYNHFIKGVPCDEWVLKQYEDYKP